MDHRACDLTRTRAMDTPGKLSVHCVVMLVLSGLLISCPTSAKAEEARICVTTGGFPLGPAISCTSGYLINVTGAEYLDLNSSLCGVNVCPCDHLACRLDVVDSVYGRALYNSIISHCQYKPQCQRVMLPRTSTFPCGGAVVLLIRYTCIDDTPMTTSNVIATEESPTSDFIAAEGSHTPPTSDDVTISIICAEIAGDSSVSGALFGVSVMAALLIVAVLVLAVCLVLSRRKTAAERMELSATRTTPTATNAALSSATNHVTLSAGPYETLEITPQAARPEGDWSATYSELTEAAAYMNMAAGRSREQRGSEPGGPERPEAVSYVNMAAGQRA